ncbi:hypothetical protein A1Q2_04050 [Trichosporon asahii var. asahii CBS 8904]|uniref:Carboxypeptidase n=1 Tax=Trichosporon asahii var. asahii (strain CBS 8904) TaxID=1220162 RepID=K1WK53_TRIAC|nr:hypothetical protein A1Q2_04050 [Trichosporon asahii var. asahii CBS 8904]
MAKKSCIDSHDYTDCSIAMSYCMIALEGSFLRAGVNPYDVSKNKRINKYLDLPEVRKKLGVDKSVGDFASCNGQVGAAFNHALDNTGQTWLYVTQLLERGVLCNHIGNEMWMEALQWTGKEGFNEAKLKDWKVNDKVAGKFKTYKNLSLLKVYGAGHMVPTDQPENAYVMLKSWLDAGKIESE